MDHRSRILAAIDRLQQQGKPIAVADKTRRTSLAARALVMPLAKVGAA